MNSSDRLGAATAASTASTATTTITSISVMPAHARALRQPRSGRDTSQRADIRGIVEGFIDIILGRRARAG
jgi:hypothetical protein